MLHHISISVNRPLRVARVLAEIMQGRVFPFPVHEGSYIVLVGDAHGTAIEVLPSGSQWIPGPQAAEVSEEIEQPPFNAVHAAISVAVSQETIEQIAAREGWFVRLCDRGPFKVIEFWLENHFLMEFLTPELAANYTDFMTLERFEAFLNQVMPIAVMS